MHCNFAPICRLRARTMRSEASSSTACGPLRRRWRTRAWNSSLTAEGRYGTQQHSSSRGQGQRGTAGGIALLKGRETGIADLGSGYLRSRSREALRSAGRLSACWCYIRSRWTLVRAAAAADGRRGNERRARSPEAASRALRTRAKPFAVRILRFTNFSCDWKMVPLPSPPPPLQCHLRRPAVK